MYTYRPSRAVMPEGERPEFTHQNAAVARQSYLRWFRQWQEEQHRDNPVVIHFRYRRMAA